jgi:YbbR domain-containing protein
VLVLALAIAIFLWGIASGTTDAERGFDIPVELHKLNESLVVIDQSVDEINVRVMGSRAALRNVSPDSFMYEIDISGGKPGVAVYDVDVSRIDLPRGARFVSHSPSRVQVRFEKRGRKSVEVRPDLEGELAPGHHLVSVDVRPSKVWLAGARSQVMRLDEVGTETINLAGLTADTEMEVRINLRGGSTVWMEKQEPVKVHIRIEPDVLPEPQEEENTALLGSGLGVREVQP